VRKGDVFSRKAVTATTELMQLRLGQDGYAFAKIDPVPKENPETKEIELTFLVDPGNRAYVRNIGFTGSTGINDDVLRREIRQMEGGYLSNAAIDRSKVRLQRLPFIEKVEVETNPVPGTPDLVDVTYDIKEGLPGQLSGGIGYSGASGFSLTGSMAHSNLLGTGQRGSLNLSVGEYSKVLSVSHTDPYTTVDGVARTISLAYQDRKQLTSSTSNLSTLLWSGGLSFGYPVTENQSVSFGAQLQHVELVAPEGTATQYVDWLQLNGDPYTEWSAGTKFYGTTYNAAELSAGWNFDTRDRTLFPTRGMKHELTLSSTLPGSGVEYLLASYEYHQFWRIPGMAWLPLRAHARLSHARGLGETRDVPPQRHFFIGGPDSVRGFRDGTLGPRDSLGNPYGGDTALSAQFEAVLPLPKKLSSTARASLFYDVGQAYYLGHTEFTDRTGDTVDTSFDLQQVRTSAGIAVEWLSAMGLFRFSYAVPLRYETASDERYGDDLESFQFSIGQSF
jgi:outer membrane protein insertion porin family